MEFLNEIPREELIKRARPRTEDHRGFFFRDITAIIHSYPFRRLKHKTQVFFAPKNDHICTRIEHVMHVATISATICKALSLDVDLAWAISLGHDFGHTPFGHVGEKILSALLEDEGGFNHELYSLYVVDKLIGYGRGLNLTYAVRDGIIHHCGEEFEQRITPEFVVRVLSAEDAVAKLPCTWEGAVMRMADKVAYLGRDLEDAVSLHLVSPDEVPGEVRSILGSSNSEIIDTLVHDIVQNAQSEGTIGFSDDVYAASMLLKKFNYSKIYESPRLAAYHGYFKRVMDTLFAYLSQILSEFAFDTDRYIGEGNSLASRFGDYLHKMESYYSEIGESVPRIVADYIAGMTDDYAIDSIQEIMIPKKFETAFEEHLYESG